MVWIGLGTIISVSIVNTGGIALTGYEPGAAGHPRELSPNQPAGRQIMSASGPLWRKDDFGKYQCPPPSGQESLLTTK